MGDHIKPQTDHMNGTEVTRQAAFEDVGWEPMVLETEAEKQAEWKNHRARSDDGRGESAAKKQRERGT